MRTGVRIQKGKTVDFGGVNHDDCRIVYDQQNNQFYSFKTGTADTKMEAFTINNFKKGGVSSGFVKEYLTKRMNQFKQDVYGEASSAGLGDSSRKAPHQLNLI